MHRARPDRKASLWARAWTFMQPVYPKRHLSSEQGATWTLLVASHDEAIQKCVAQALADRQSRIVVAPSVRAFFEELGRRQVDLIVFDLGLPPLSTVEAFAVERVHHPRIPTILLQEREELDEIREILDRGIIFRMLKPIEVASLRQICDTVRQRKVAAASHERDESVSLFF